LKSHLSDLLVAPRQDDSSIYIEAADLRCAMSRLLFLAALIVALWAIDSYAFHGRYRAAALEDINYYAKALNDGVQSFVRRLSP
jgi:hypothetical protein